MASVKDQWAAGSSYEEFMGRWSRQLAPKFVTWLDVPAGAHWLDVGCGTGSLAAAICEVANPASVVGCDPAEPLVAYARGHHSDERLSFVSGGVGSLPSRLGGFGSVTSSLALNFFPEPASAMEEMRGICAKEATLSACVWDYAGRMDFLRWFWDVASRHDAPAGELDEGERFPLCRPDALEDLFRGAGLRDVVCAPVEITTLFSSFEEYWRPFLGGTGPAPSYVSALGEERRLALADELDRRLPRQPDGTIALVARAWAVRGVC